MGEDACAVAMSSTVRDMPNYSGGCGSMQPGVGAWVRVREGRVVLKDEDGRAGDNFVPVPTEAILRQPSALDRFMKVSTLGLGQQHAALVYEGEVLLFERLADAKFVLRARHEIRPYMLPSPAVADQRSLLIPLNEQHVGEIFGDWGLAPAKLASWNESISTVLALCDDVDAWKQDRDVLLNAAQRAHLIDQGLLRMDLFDPPAHPELRAAAATALPFLSGLFHRLKRTAAVVVIAYFVLHTLPTLRSKLM